MDIMIFFSCHIDILIFQYCPALLQDRLKLCGSFKKLIILYCNNTWCALNRMTNIHYTVGEPVAR